MAGLVGSTWFSTCLSVQMCNRRNTGLVLRQICNTLVEKKAGLLTLVKRLDKNRQDSFAKMVRNKTPLEIAVLQESSFRGSRWVGQFWEAKKPVFVPFSRSGGVCLSHFPTQCSGFQSRCFIYSRCMAQPIAMAELQPPH